MASSNAQRKRISKSTSSKSKSGGGKKQSPPRKETVRPEVKIFVTAFLLFVLLLSFYTPLFGIFGRFVRNLGLAFFGFPGYIIPVYLIALFAHKCAKGTLRPYGKVYLCAAGIVVLISSFLTIRASYGEAEYITSFEDLILGGTSLTDGGIAGWLGMPVMKLFGAVGGEILIIFLIVVLLAVATNFLPIIYSVIFARRLFSYIARKVKESREYEDEEEAEEAPAAPIELPAQEEPKKERRKKAPKEETPEKAPKKTEKKKKETENDSVPQVSFFIPSPNTPGEKEQDFSDINIFDFSDIKITPEDEPPEKEQTPPEAGESAKKTEDAAPIEVTDEEINEDVIPYEFPPITLLEKNTDRSAGGSGTDLREQAKKLIETLHSFGVEARVLEVNKGPSVTRFEIQPNTGVKVSKIVGLSDDIALNLAALSVRIEAPIPGKAAVGIEIPNAGTSLVRLREVIDSPEFRNFKSKTAFALGKDITGRPIVTDIAKMPHALIAGATGSGKSVCINALITSIIYKADPNDVKLIMIDPKAVELNVYNGIPHLLIPVVTDPRKAAGALSWAVQEMTKRYALLSDLNVRNIESYNEYVTRNGEKPLPHIIIIVDELADLMMVAPHDVEDAICRLAQLARAAGMHLIVATQRPSVDVITGLIKANIPTRIAFAVASQIDSRTILDMSGAEKLLGKGDMLFLPVGASKPMRVQGAFIDDNEVNRIVAFISDSEKRYDEDVMEKIDSGAVGEKDKGGKDADEYLPRAIEVVIEAGQASASLLQSRLGVGYARARRLVDQLEERGIIGPYEGAKPRTVLISRAEYAEMLMQ